MAIYASPSDQFNSRSNRTMIGRCGSWTRTQQGKNMPILFKTQVNRTAKMPIPARRARGGGLCGFRSPAERVPTGSLKIGRCAGVRECWRKMLILARTAVGKAACDKRGNTPKRAKSRDFARCGEKAARKQDKAAGSCAPRSDHICPRCGQFWTFARAFQKQRKTDGGRCRMRKARCFKKNSGVPTKFAR
mgnify:CR=1 FL=1